MENYIKIPAAGVLKEKLGKSWETLCKQAEVLLNKKVSDVKKNPEDINVMLDNLAQQAEQLFEKEKQQHPGVVAKFEKYKDFVDSLKAISCMMFPQAKFYLKEIPADKYEAFKKCVVDVLSLIKEEKISTTQLEVLARLFIRKSDDEIPYVELVRCFKENVIAVLALFTSVRFFAVPTDGLSFVNSKEKKFINTNDIVLIIRGPEDSLFCTGEIEIEQELGNITQIKKQYIDPQAAILITGSKYKISVDLENLIKTELKCPLAKINLPCEKFNVRYSHAESKLITAEISPGVYANGYKEKGLEAQEQLSDYCQWVFPPYLVLVAPAKSVAQKPTISYKLFTHKVVNNESIVDETSLTVSNEVLERAQTQKNSR